MKYDNDPLDNQIILSDMEEIHAKGYDWNRFDGCSFLITGAYGMLASYVAYYLIYLREYKSINVELYIQGRNRGKAEKRFGIYLDKPYIHYIGEDILADGAGEIKVADYVIHAAGIANPRFYSTNPVEVIEPNVIGTYRLLKNCIGKEINGFLLFSSGDIYGRVLDNQNITEQTMGEMDPLDGHSCYGESKRIAETMCSSFYHEYGIRTLIARIGHTYGPTMDIDNDPRVFASFIKSALNGEDIVLHSDGLAKRPFCYITDAVAGYFLLLLTGKGGEAYNVTNTAQFHSIREVAQVISSIPKKKLDVKFMKRSNDDSYKDNRLNPDNKPVENKLYDLGWTNPVDIKEGFSRVYNYFYAKD